MKHFFVSVFGVLALGAAIAGVPDIPIPITPLKPFTSPPPKPLQFFVLPENSYIRCFDGVDNDYDGHVDCIDPSCRIKFPKDCAIRHP